MQQTTSTASRANIGLVGLGYWGSKYIRVISSGLGSRLSFVVDSSADNLNHATVTNDVPRFVSLKRALNEVRTDGVVVATPAATHADIVRECLDAHVPVMVEKPFTVDLSDSFSLIQASIAQHSLVFPGHIYVFNSTVQQLKNDLLLHGYGSPRFVAASRLAPGPVRKDVNTAWDLLPHDLTILDVIGLDKPETVQAYGCEVLGNKVQDAVTVLLTYANNRVAELAASWVYPVKVRQFSVVTESHMGLFDELSSTAHLTWSPHSYWARSPQVPSLNSAGFLGPTGPSTDPHLSEPLASMFQFFLDACRTPQIASPEVLRALRVMTVLDAIQTSLGKGGESVNVDWSLANKFAQMMGG